MSHLINRIHQKRMDVFISLSKSIQYNKLNIGQKSKGGQKMEDIVRKLVLAEDEKAFFACLSEHYHRSIGLKDLSELEDAHIYLRLYQLYIMDHTTDYEQTILKRFLVGRCDWKDIMSLLKTKNRFYQVAVLTGGKAKQQKQVADIITSLVDHVFTVSFDTHLVFLFHFNHGPLLPNSAQMMLKEQLNLRHLHLFFSYPYPHLQDTPTFYEQALFASQLLKNELLIFVDEGFMPLLLAGFENQKLLTSLIHPHVLRLQDHDVRYHTHFYETLEAYLSCSRNITKTIERLGIGRSTLFYRFNKIGEILKGDFYELDFFAYEISFAIIHFKEGGFLRESLAGS